VGAYAPKGFAFTLSSSSGMRFGVRWADLAPLAAEDPWIPEGIRIGGEGRNWRSLAPFIPRQLIRACAGVFKPTKADPGEKRPRGSRLGSRFGAAPDKLFIKSYSYRRSKMDPAEPRISVLRATRLSGIRA